MLPTSASPYKYQNLSNIKNFFTNVFNSKNVVITLLLLLSFSETSIAQSSQGNIGFEYNNLSYWTCYDGGSKTIATDNGTINTTTTTLYNGTTYYVAGSGVKTNFIRVTSPNQKNDPYGNYPVVCPLQGAGNHSVKLGTDSVSDGSFTYGISTSQGIVYNVRIPVNAKKYKIVFYYAIDLESPYGHTCSEMPFFKVDAYDSITQVTVSPCSNISSNLCDAMSSSWNKSKVLHDVYGDGTELDSIYYMNWTPATIIAKNMGGRTMTMRFTSSGCTLGAHFGYAYVDFDSTSFNVTNYMPDTLRYRSSDTCFNYMPPSGYKGYTIIDSATGEQLGIDTSHALGAVTTITMCGTNMPKPKSVMQVVLTPYSGISCTDTISYYIDTFPVNQKTDTIYLSGCNSLSYKGNIYNSSTIVYESIKNIQGYDSAYHMVIITISNIVPTTKTINLNSCDSVFYKNLVFKKSTSFSDTIRSIVGCDSIYVKVNISIVNNSISGGIYHPSKGYTILNVLALMSGSNNLNVLGTGNYSFNCLNNGSNETVRLYKNNDINKSNGVTAVDIALTQGHILGKNIFNSPYKLIGADVNGDGKVTALDIVYMKRLILGIDSTFTNSTTKQTRLWAFVDSSYKFPDTTNPFPFKDSISYTGLSASKTNQTFIGCKLGDVNWDWNPAIARPMVNNVNAVELSYSYPSDAQPGRTDVVRIPVRVMNFKEMLGVQFTISFDPIILQWQGISNNPLGIETGTTHANEGSVSFLWVDKQNNIKTLEDGSVLMELVFKPTGKEAIGKEALVNILSLDGTVTTIAAYNKDFGVHNVIMKRVESVHHLQLEYWTVAPNPTKDGVIKVQMNLKDNKTVVFRLIDNTGRVLLVKQVEGVKGSNNITLKEGSVSSGTYYLQAVGVEGGKQIRIDN